MFEVSNFSCFSVRVVSDNMDISLHAVIRYLSLIGLTPKEIHEVMVVTLGENAHSHSMVKKWAAEFKCGRESLEDDPRRRRPVTVTTQETIAKIRDIVMANRRVTEYYTATELGISLDHIHVDIHNKHHMSKVSARCVPKLIGLDLKWTRLNMSREHHVIFHAGTNSFLQRFVTMDETWVHHFQPETKKQSKQWKPSLRCP